MSTIKLSTLPYEIESDQTPGRLSYLPGCWLWTSTFDRNCLTQKSIIMKANMGTTDRVIRLVLAAVMIFLAYSGTVTGIVATVFYILAVVFILTSLVRTCPLYMPFGLSTCKVEKK